MPATPRAATDLIRKAGLSRKMSSLRSTDQEGDQPPPEVNLLPGQGAVAEEALQQLEGRISRVVFEGRDGYAVYALTVDGGDDATVSVTSATRFSRGDKIVEIGRAHG